jgi:hypothetical protein
MLRWKVKLSLCLTNLALPPETIWGSRCIDPYFFSLELVGGGGGVFSFNPWFLYAREISLGTGCTRGWIGPTACLDDVERSKYLTLPKLGTRTLRSCSHSLGLPWYGLYARWGFSWISETCPGKYSYQRSASNHATAASFHTQSPESDSAPLPTYSVALVRERTIPTERPPLVDEVSANFCW